MELGFHIEMLYGFFNDVDERGKCFNSSNQYKRQKIQGLQEFWRITKMDRKLQY